MPECVKTTAITLPLNCILVNRSGNYLISIWQDLVGFTASDFEISVEKHENRGDASREEYRLTLLPLVAAFLFAASPSDVRCRLCPTDLLPKEFRGCAPGRGAAPKSLGALGRSQTSRTSDGGAVTRTALCRDTIV
jgi:hypothetical protein